jgi:hypothetical protein
MVLAVKWIVFVFLLGWMVRAGFFGRSVLFNWPMFSRVSNCQLDLRDEAGRPVNPWEHIAHQDPGMNAWELECYLAFLRDVHNLRVNGTATVVDYMGNRTWTVRGSRVVA